MLFARARVWKRCIITLLGKCWCYVWSWGLGCTYALLALAVMKTLSMWKDESCICDMMTGGRYTPDEARPAPKRAPAVEEVKKVRDIVNETSREELSVVKGACFALIEHRERIGLDLD